MDTRITKGASLLREDPKLPKTHNVKCYFDGDGWEAKCVGTMWPDQANPHPDMSPQECCFSGNAVCNGTFELDMSLNPVGLTSGELATVGVYLGY